MTIIYPKLATICRVLQENDHNADFDTLLEDVMSGETTLEQAYEACDHALKTIIQDIPRSDKTELKKWQGWLNFLRGYE